MRPLPAPAVTAALVALGAVPAVPLVAAAQGDDFAAYYATLLTPVGALAPLAPVTPDGPGRGAMLRYGQLRLDGGETLRSVAFRTEWGADARRVGWTIGAQGCDGCTRTIMTGFDLVVPLGAAAADTARRARLHAALAPSLNAAVPMAAPSGVVVALALALPLRAEIPIGARARLVPLVQPGVATGFVLSGGGGGYGLAPMLGGGVELTGLGGGLGVSVGAQRTLVSGAELQLGAALTWRPAAGAR